jgi:hypothetical protein
MAGRLQAACLQSFWRESDGFQGYRDSVPILSQALPPLFSQTPSGWGGLGAPTAGSTLEHVAVVKQTIEHGADGGNIAEQLAPVVDGAVGSEQRADALVTSHDDLRQIFGGGVRQFAHAEVINDEQRYSGDQFHIFFARTISDGVGQFIEQDVGFAIQHAVTLLNGGLADGLRQVTFASASRA